MSDKFIYIADIRFPTDKAHGIQIAKMCEAFAQSGMDVSLWVPRRHTPIQIDAFTYYGVKRNLDLTYVRCIDLTRFGKFGFFIQSATFWISIVGKSLYQKNTFFYTRSAVIAMVLRILQKKVAFEVHMGHISFLVKKLIQYNTKLIVISNGLKNLLISLGAKETSLFVAPDAVNREEFNCPVSKNDARKKLGIDLEKKVVLYTGHLYSWKGVKTLAQASMLLPDAVEVIFVGGTERDVADFRSRFNSKNVVFLGKKPHSEIPMYLRCADVLVIPNSAIENISRLYTSPMKLFEYMASGVPIIASDLPSLREIVNEETVTFFTPDNAHSLANSILKTLEDAGAQKKAQNAYEKVGDYSWESRARNIVSFIKAS